ncbi:putative WRKY transcription factor 70 [Morella rubra]|uniref:Putative WRKY transcription factor 70 n=1 Tax=Morella rubra TaxID=262757 RepID=A0A6A1WHI6_9ROSI|nr:putative WRKY transcription factor 70 [Morella rubra]
MESSLPESLPSKRIRAIEEVIQGCQFANQLRSLLNSSRGDDGSTLAMANDLVLKILSSFTNSHTILSSDEFDEASQLQPNTHGSNSESSHSQERKSSQASTKDTATLMDDGHAWIKYGQKVILNAEYPRHYYRCTHKLEQGCQATKYVQRIQADPPKYRTTYMGCHTCMKFPKTPAEIIFQLSQSDSRSPVISFGNSTIANKENSCLSTFIQSTKQEHNEYKPTNDEITNYQAPSYDYLMSSRQTQLNSFAHSTVLSECDIRDVISKVLVGPVSFGDNVTLFDF